MKTYHEMANSLFARRDAYIYAMKTRSTRKRKIIAVISAILCLTIVIAAIPIGMKLSSRGNEEEDLPSLTDTSGTSVLQQSPPDKPMSSASISVSCVSFYKKDTTIELAVGYGDEYRDRANAGMLPEYAVFSVLDVDPLSRTDPKENSLIQINGIVGEYNKRYEADELEALDCPAFGDPLYFENVTLDMSDLSEGGSGCLRFGWINHSQNSQNGNYVFLYYYVEADVVRFSFDSIEDAQKNFESNTITQTRPAKMSYCCAKPLY